MVESEGNTQTFIQEAGITTSNVILPAKTLATEPGKQIQFNPSFCLSTSRIRLGSIGSSFDSDSDNFSVYPDSVFANINTSDSRNNLCTSPELVNCLSQAKLLNPSCEFRDLDFVLMAEGPDPSSVEFSFAKPETWYYEFPQDLCGRLIGKNGRNINFIKQQSGANVYVTKAGSHVMLRTVKISGTIPQIQNAVELIESKFPGLHLGRITNVQFLPVVAKKAPAVKISQVQLALNVESEITICNILDAGHFYVQLYSTATQSILSGLQMDMKKCYDIKGQGKHLPSLPQPPVKGTYCAAPADEGWFRAQVVDISAEGRMANVLCVDYGCCYRVPFSSLKQLRADFLKIPFQAVECHLANVVPLSSEITYSASATNLLEDLTQGKIIQAIPRSYRNGILCLDLHVFGNAGEDVFVNKELVDRNVARWSNAAAEVQSPLDPPESFQ